MSSITNVILTCSCGEESALRQLNAELRKFAWAEGAPFADIDETCPSAVAGKHAFEAIVAMGAFNFFHLPEFLAAVSAVPWRWRDQVQVFLKDQDQERFEEIPIKVRPTPHRY